MIAFFAALHHDQSANLIKYIEQYITDASASYLIALETSKNTHLETQGQHIHICINSTTFNYDTFRNTILKNKYSLQGQARNGIGRQYGKIKDVRDETKLLTYCCKEANNNIYFKNIDLKTIQEYITNSFKKESHLSLFEKLMEHLTNIPYTNTTVDYYCYYAALEDATIDYYIDNNVGKSLTKNHMRSLVTSFLMYHSKITKTKRYLIHRYIRN